MTLQPGARYAEADIMLTTSDIPGDDPTALATGALGTSAIVGSSLEAAQDRMSPASDPLALTPKGPTDSFGVDHRDGPGLRGAGAADHRRCGDRLVTTPFDYDPALAFDLDDDPVVAAVSQIGPTAV
jgi:hypothetical protein